MPLEPGEEIEPAEAKIDLTLYPLSNTNKKVTKSKDINNINIMDIDLVKRSIKEWSEIYHINIQNTDYINIYQYINEYNFAWLMINQLQYDLVQNEESAQWELRSYRLYLDIIKNATPDELLILEDEFIPTNFIRKQMKNINCD